MRENDTEENPMRDVDFTSPTYPSGNLRTDHLLSPHQHRFEVNDPSVGSRSGFRRSGPELLD